MADAPSASQNERSKTPENHKPLPTTVSGTPIVPRVSGSMPKATGETPRNKFYDRMAQEIDGKIIPDLEVREFLDKFLPKLASKDVVSRLSSDFKKNWTQVLKANEEDAMYKPFVDAVNLYLKNVKLVDFHSTQFHRVDGADIKPDVVLFDKKNDTSIGGVGMMIEMKFPEGVDPFDAKKQNDKQDSTLGQICAYAAAHMAAQFRTHVFSALVFPKFARLLRWDRAGVVVTKKISFESTESTLDLVEFFRRYDLSSCLDRGVDPYVTSFSNSDFAKHKTPEGGEDIKTAFTGSIDAKTVHQKITFPGGQNPTESEPRTYVVATPYYMGTMSVIGRSTRTFRAYCLQTGKIVFLKDTWRILQNSILPEHETYAKLAAANVSYVATAIDYHDMESQETKTTHGAPPTESGKASKFRSFRHYRIVLKEFARPIEDFKNVKELLTVFWNTIQAHNEGCHRAKILHRDISSGNIMIYNGHGLLVDWDFSKPIGTLGPRSPERTGTWQFIAYRLAKTRQNNEPFPEHNEGDDLESFWYVLFWVALRRCEHNVDVDTISTEMKVLFDGSMSAKGIASANVAKIDALRAVGKIDDYRFPSLPIAQALREFQAIICLRYTLQPLQIEFVFKIWKKVEDDFPTLSTEDQIVKFEDVLHSLRNETLLKDISRLNALSIRLLSDQQWAQNLFSRIFENTSSACWDIGGGNRMDRHFPPPFSTTGSRKRKARGEDGTGIIKRSHQETVSELTQIPEHAA